MLQRVRRRIQGEEGFTLIELLVVILIVGILAAIAIPTFLNQKSKANDASAKSAARTAQTAEETYFTDHQAYTATESDLTALESALPSNLAADIDVDDPADAYDAAGVAEATPAPFVVKVPSTSGVTYAIVKLSTGTAVRTCNVPAGKNAGGCSLPSGSTSGNGTW